MDQKQQVNCPEHMPDYSLENAWATSNIVGGAAILEIAEHAEAFGRFLARHMHFSED